MTGKAIIFDSSALISFSINGLTEELKKLKDIFNGYFFITESVKGEIIDKPLTTKRFELEALRIKELFDNGVIELPSGLGIKNSEIEKNANEFLEIANNAFYSENSKEKIKLISLGEASCLALSRILNKKGIENVVAVDERTTRILGEKPDNLRKIFESKMHTKITAKHNNFKNFEGFRFIRSSELVYILYKKSIIDFKSVKKEVILDSLLWAVKFSGCSISEEEIAEIKRLDNNNKT